MKEGLSIYGLFQQLACTSQGRHSLRQMFLRPTMNLALIQERQQTISLLLRPDNCDLMNKTSTILRKIKNITTVVERLRKGVDSPSACHSFDRSVWATLRDFSVHVLRLKEILGAMSCESEAGIFRKVGTQTY